MTPGPVTPGPVTPGPVIPEPVVPTPRVLVVTNDFPPRAGGIQSFVYGLVSRLPPESVVVYASTSPGAAEFDRAQRFPVVRDRSTMLLPTPAVRRRVVATMREYGCDRVCFGASFPLGLMANQLRARGARRCVGLTHGHEAPLTKVPLVRSLLRRIAGGLDVMTVLGEYQRRMMAPVVGRRTELVELNPGVDSQFFRPRADAGADIRRRYGLAGRRVIVCVSRLVPRKGQDMLIRALPAVRAVVPAAALLIVGDGDDRRRLARIAAAAGVSESVRLVGEIPAAELPAHYAAGEVFAMPCRTRRTGFDVEGLGIVFLEAAATGIPVLAGDSGGAPDAVLPGETGVVVDGRDVREISTALVELLSDVDRSRRMGAAGRDWVLANWAWESRVNRFQGLLNGTLE